MPVIFMRHKKRAPLYTMDDRSPDLGLTRSAFLSSQILIHKSFFFPIWLYGTVPIGLLLNVSELSDTLCIYQMMSQRSAMFIYYLFPLIVFDFFLWGVRLSLFEKER